MDAKTILSFCLLAIVAMIIWNNFGDDNYGMN